MVCWLLGYEVVRRFRRVNPTEDAWAKQRNYLRRAFSPSVLVGAKQKP